MLGSRLPWSSLTVGQQIHSDPKLSFFRAASWLRNCLQTHKGSICEQPTNGLPNAMPTRLVSIDESQNRIRLIECGDKRFPYFALSYCWGPTEHSSTTEATYQDRLRNIPWSPLPKTYKDAIDFTRALGYRYIWIDSICIIQDKEDDRHHEASLMGETYRNAILTISAANAKHVHFGCLTERAGSSSFKTKMKRYADDPSHILVQEPNTHLNLMSSPPPKEEWPIFKRAWTLQERLLATRIIHFAAGELVWECASAPACECGHLDRTRAITPTVRYSKANIDDMTASERAQAWDDLALAYQRRALTQEGDRLSALSGLAQQFQDDRLGRYVAGVWSNYALSCMLWEVKSGQRANTFNAPSWSWASVHGSLTRNDPIESNRAFEAEIVEIKSELASLDPFGAITSASATITTPIADGRISLQGRHSNAMISFNQHVVAFFVSDVPIRQEQVGSRVKCAFFRGLKDGPSGRYIEALVLQLSQTMDAYERLGVAHLTEDSLAYLESLRLGNKTVTIV